MTPEEALQLLHNMAARYQGTLADHQALQTALKTLGDAVGHKDTPAEANGNRATRRAQERKASARKATAAK